MVIVNFCVSDVLITICRESGDFVCGMKDCVIGVYSGSGGGMRLGFRSGNCASGIGLSCNSRA